MLARDGTRRTPLIALILLPFVGACAGATGTTENVAPAAAAIPGFDTRTYPGDGVMQQWFGSSPYRWVGYYLPAPCHPRSTWTGRRQALDAMGWGFAVIYIGEQDWSAVTNPPRGPGDTADGAAPRCTHANLTAEQGTADGADAAASVAEEGFAPGTTVYLNVERVDTVSAALEAYVRAWVAAVHAAGTARPGLYVHRDNAKRLAAAASAELAARGAAGDVPLWVAAPGRFRLDARPADSGVAEADIWQGSFNVRETWGGATLTIDANIARTASPSGQ